jgi:hypothetical protein
MIPTMTELGREVRAERALLSLDTPGAHEQARNILADKYAMLPSAKRLAKMSRVVGRLGRGPA